MKSIGLLLAAACPFLLIACETTSTATYKRPNNQFAAKTRIKKSPEKFAKLSSSQKKVVEQGNIAKGLSKDAVRLAWGKPDKVEKVGKGEQWVYFRREMVNLDPQTAPSSFSQFYSGSQKFWDGHAGPETLTVQREDRTVLFDNGRVKSWTRAKH